MNILEKLEQSINVERITDNEIDTLFGSASGTGTNAQDYVVEHGTSGIWEYRKWASGVSECWGIQRHTVTGWGAWGSIYEGTPAIPQIDYPTGLFTSYPNVSMNSDGTYSTSGTIGVEIYKWGSNTKTPLGYLLRPNTVSGSITYDVHITAKGTWK